MPATPYEAFTSPYLVLPVDNVDTDQIIPARFLTTVERTGLGAAAFADWRYLSDGSPDEQFVLNRPDAARARVLVTGRNFGCGSSREHAVWALQGAGFRAVVSAGFADIFRANALGNGLLPVEVPPHIIQRLARDADSPGAALTVDLEAQALQLPGGERVHFPIPAFARHCLMHGVDELDFVLSAEDEVDAYELGRPARVATRVAEVAE